MSIRPGFSPVDSPSPELRELPDERRDRRSVEINRMSTSIETIRDAHLCN
jgi:hypothetical protein